MLASSSIWNCDGTFKSAPNFFFQNYVVHGFYMDKVHLPSAFGCLTSKNFEMYSTFINSFQDEADNLDLKLNPKLIMVDFEKAAIKAFRRAFPSVRIKGCLFHFTNAIFKKVVDLGFKVIYKENKDLRILNRDLKDVIIVDNSAYSFCF